MSFEYYKKYDDFNTPKKDRSRKKKKRNETVNFTESTKKRKRKVISSNVVQKIDVPNKPNQTPTSKINTEPNIVPKSLLKTLNTPSQNISFKTKTPTNTPSNEIPKSILKTTNKKKTT